MIPVVWSVPTHRKVIELKHLNSIAEGDCIEIQDGSHWKVLPSDISIARSWRPGDVLVISLNKGWFSSHEYWIYNLSIGGYVRADLQFAPLDGGPFTLSIKSIDRANRTVTLKDSSRLVVAFPDSGYLDVWKTGDSIIVAYHDSIFAAHDLILINASRNHKVRAALLKP